MRISFQFLAAFLLGCFPGAPARAAIVHETASTVFEREALAFVQVLERQPGSIRSSFALPSCAERALTGLHLNGRLAQRFVTNLTASFEENVGLPVAGATSVKIVAFHREGTEVRFLCRAIQRDESVAYLDLIVERSRMAGCAVVDAFDYSVGLKLSEIARGTIEARAKESQKSDHQWLLGSRSDESKSAPAVDQFLQLAHRGDCVGALAAYAKLPSAVQRERMILRTQIRCALPTDLAACSAALALWRASFPSDDATDLLALSYFKRRKLHTQYLDAVDRVDRLVGGDAYLDVVRARYCEEQLAGERAEQFARQAVQRDPGLRAGHQALVSALLRKGDFEGVAQALSAEEKALAMDLGAAVRKAAQESGSPLAGFARSEPGIRWLSTNQNRRVQRAAQAEVAATSSNGQYKLEDVEFAGGRNVATINGRPVVLGDRLVGGFRVSRIGPASVNLVSTNGEVETLTLTRGLAGADETESSR